MEMEEMDLRQYWEIIVKKRSVVAIVFAVTVLAVTVYSLLATPIYEAYATLMVRDSSAGVTSMLFEGLGGGGGGNTAQNYIQIMKSRRILEQVASTMGLEEDVSLASLEKAMTIQPVQGSDILKISMQSPDPEEAQTFVNTLTDVFIEWNLLYKQEDRRSAREFIQLQLVNVSENLREAEEKLRDFREQERSLSPTQETIAGITQLAELEAELGHLQVRKIEIRERISQARQQLESQEETLISSTTINENPFVTQYRARLADLEIALSGAKEKYTANHPSILSLQAEIEDVKAKLTEQVERVIGTETRTINPLHRELYASVITQEVELMALDAREAGLRSLIEDYEHMLSQLPTKELELARLMRDAKVMEELYIMLMTRNEENRIAEAMQTADVQVIDEAILPLVPVKPRVKLNIAIGAVLGIFLGVGLAFLLEFVDNTFKTKDDVERMLGVPVLGQIPDLNLIDSTGQRRHFQRKKGRGYSAHV